MDYFDPEIEARPRAYFSLSICAHMRELADFSDLVCRSVVLSLDEGLSDTRQISQRNEWKDLLNCNDRIAKDWSHIFLLNAPYDFHWCREHLILWRAVRDLEILVDSGEQNFRVGSISLTCPKPQDKISEIYIQFKALTSLTYSIEDACRRNEPQHRMPSVRNFEP